jgi:SAM-dependent methyltransferase
LDLGCGEGGDAIWLALQGWRVTAIDVSATALDRAAADAATAGVADRIDFRQHDLALTFPSGAFDLVSAQYLHSPIEFPRVHVLQEAASAVTPYGLLLIVDHASVSPGSWADPEETLAPLDLSPDEWHTERLEDREREATGPNGQRATVTDNVIAVRRLTRPQ